MKLEKSAHPTAPLIVIVTQTGNDYYLHFTDEENCSSETLSKTCQVHNASMCRLEIDLLIHAVSTSCE